MNSKERVRLAFNHQEPDRVPIFELKIENPTASFVLGREAICGFGGQVRGVIQKQALQEGWIEAFHRRRVTDEIELWRKLDLDVHPNVAPYPASLRFPNLLG